MNNLNIFLKNIKNKFNKIEVKNIFLLWITLGLIIILIVSVFLVFKPTKRKKLVLNESDKYIPVVNKENTNNALLTKAKKIKKDEFKLSDSINPEITNTLKQVYSLLDENNTILSIGEIKTEVNTNFSMTWEVKDGREIIDTNSPGIRWVAINFIDDEVEEFKLKVLPMIESVFTKNGFIKDKDNSGDYPEYNGEFDWYYNGYYVFNKDNIKCVISVYPNTTNPTDINIVCSDQYEKNYQYQTEIINNLGNDLSVSATSRPLGKVTLFDRYGIFKFVGPSQSFLVTGMMDANDKWHILWQGFNGDGLPCELLDEHPIFKEYYPTPYCYYREGERTGEYVEWN